MGSGKSYILQLLPLMLIDDQRTNIVMMRRTNPQIKGQGGIFETGCGIYNSLPLNLRPKIRTQDMEVIFPRKDELGKTHYDGATIKYQQAENVEQSKLNMQGLQFTGIFLDEATQFTWDQIEYFMSRLRSESKHFSRMVMSCNPDPDHELRKKIAWYLDEEGYPRPDRDGTKRYFIVEGGEWIWADTQEELAEKYDIPKEKWEGKILSFAFVSGTIYDNPIMIEKNPSYLAFLEGLNDVDKAQLLHGNWDARPKGANYFERDWLQEVDRIPTGANCCRAYDFAATERSQVNKSPDATTSIKMYKDREGYFTITGEYHNDYIDEELSVQGRMCKRVGDRDNVIIKQAHYDGSDCVIVSPIDPAAAGKQVFTEFSKKMANEGFRVKKDPVPNNRAKLQRFLPFADAAENGLIRIVKSTFDPVTYEFIMKEMEAFDGKRSSSGRHDDFPDCIASAYNYLCTSRVVKSFKLPSTNSATKLQQYRSK